MTLRLRPLRLDESEYPAAPVELAVDGFTFGFIRDGETFAEHVARLDEWRRGRQLADGFVEGTWLVADVGGTIVGRASVRHELNEACGGVLGRVVPGAESDDSIPFRRYWIS